MKRICAWLPALLWMGVIYLMSAAPGDVSGEQSGLVVDVILSVYGGLFGGAQPTPEQLGALEFMVRKAAHMSEYAVLALCYLYALKKSGAARPTALALLLAAAYACTDELHQAFVPDRGPSPVDVMIDTAGAGLGLLAGHLALWARRRRQMRRQ